MQILKTSKEFDFVYKNSYKFRSESLDICVLKPNLVGQFYEKFRRLPCNLVGFSVSKKVGNAVERNLIKRRLRAICREFFGEGNLFWGMQFVPFSHKTALDERPSSISLVSRKNGTKPHRHYFDCDSQGESTTNQAQNCNNPSLRDSTQRVESWQSTKFTNDSHDSKHANFICIFIAKRQILQTPFVALKSTIFATFKKQMRFMNNAHSAHKMANHHKSPRIRQNVESSKIAHARTNAK